jgi:FlaA1/EpsC-like NDP-sugar epimerase
MRRFDSITNSIGGIEETFDQSIVQAALAGKCVLITGAAGFIGSALARSLSQYPIDRLLLLDVAESGLHELSLEIERNGTIADEEIVGDVCDLALLKEVFDRYAPRVVLHAAACKHVALMEKNPFAAAKTNILGTCGVADAASAFGVDELILISTDKAVEPASMMGATKRIAELIVLANRSATRMKVVRLSNVWGSTGSVVPILQRQIDQGGPVTITDAACMRHFLSIEQAVRRLLSALVFERTAALFVAEAGPSRRIVEIAELLLHQSGVKRENIEFRFIGLHPGEKISEQLTSDEEKLAFPGVYGLHEVLASPGPSSQLLATAIHEIGAAIESRDLCRLLEAVLDVVPGYKPSDYLRQQAIHCAIATSIA